MLIDFQHALSAADCMSSPAGIHPTPLVVYIAGVGVWGAGMSDWTQAAASLRERRPPVATLPLPVADVLPAAERRRSPATARIAVHVASEACARAGIEPGSLPCVFASSHGDTQITDLMCRELAAAVPALSPTRFHNSVHNAAGGYWSIAVHCRESINAVTAGDDSFGAGLLEAATQCVADQRPCLLVAYDLAAPSPLASVCAIAENFGVALVLTPDAGPNRLARLRSSGPVIDSHLDPLPEPLARIRARSPAARALPLLCSLADRKAAQLALAPYRWESEPWT